MNLKGNGIRDEGLEVLSKALLDNHILEELDISLNEITPIGNILLIYYFYINKIYFKY